MKINKNTLLLGAGLLTGVATGYLFTCNQTPAQQQLKDIRKAVEKNEAAIYNKIAAVQIRDKVAMKELTSTRNRLEQKSEVKDKLYKTLKEVVVSNVPDTASAVLIMPSFLTAVSESDSLFRQVIDQQDTLLGMKDTLIGYHQSAYASLRISFDQSMQQHEALLQINKTLSKDLKKERRKNKTIAVVSILVTGLTAAYLISR